MYAVSAGVGSSAAQISTCPALASSPKQMFSQFKQLLDAAEAKVSGFDQLQAALEAAQKEVKRLEQEVQTQQRQLDSFCAQDQLVSQLTRRLAAQSQALEQLEASSQRREKQFETVQTQATELQQEVGQKRKRIQDLESDGTSKVQKIQQLQHKLQEYRGICSYVTSHTQQLEQQLLEQQAEQQSQQGTEPQQQLMQAAASGRQCSAGAGSEMKTSADLPDQDNSVAEGAAGLMAMTSTADRSQETQSRDGAQHSADDPTPEQDTTPLRAGTTARGSASQDARTDSAPKRASCVITGRHPGTPAQVPVVCRQLTGTLLLGDCCQQLKILHNGSEVLPPDFEAAAGCSRGKNWKASIKVQGSNGRNQMLKVWLPGLVHLIGDHSKTAVDKETDIKELLDSETGLRILTNE